MQRYGYVFLPKRAAIYSADMVSRQYAIKEGEVRFEIDYDKVQPVYTIILMEQSSGVLAQSDAYIHHFKQRSDTGLEMELFQYTGYCPDGSISCRKQSLSICV
ncbi:MAG: hypothetical protein J1F22_06320 [Lachnospiraceae bacterium]|nr:hypothetical protein [Lachnospiraceae bacterium]